jgi:hypothetical protein
MKTLLAWLLILFYSSAIAQQNTATVSVKFKKDAGQIIYFQYGKSIDKHATLDRKGRFKEKVTDTGFYSVVNNGNILRIYLAPRMNLTIGKKIKNGTTIYTFAGKGKNENVFLNRLAAEQAKHLPVKWNLLSDDVNFIPPAEFLKRLGQYKSESLKLLAKQHFSKYFIAIHAAYIDCLTRKYALQYMENYGINIANKKIYLAKLENGDTSLNTPQGKQAALNSVYTKELTFNERVAVFNNVYNGFNVNNEALYKCSAEYCDLIDEWINSKASGSAEGGLDNSFAVRRVIIIKNNITNQFMQKKLLAKYLAQI